MRAEGYLQALGDLPAWAVEMAAGDWMRGVGYPGANFSFAPSPPQLRQRSSHYANVMRGRAVVLSRLADAKAGREFSDEHRREMAERFKTLLRPATTEAA